MKTSSLEMIFYLQCKEYCLSTPKRQFRFAAEHVGLGKGIRERLKKTGLQDWRFDFLFDEWLAVEVNGGTHINGRHNRGAALTSEYRKINKAHELGFTVIIFDAGMVKSGEAVEQVKRLLDNRPNIL